MDIDWFEIHKISKNLVKIPQNGLKFANNLQKLEENPKIVNKLAKNPKNWIQIGIKLIKNWLKFHKNGQKLR